METVSVGRKGTSGWVLSRTWPWAQLTLPPCPQLSSWARPHYQWAPPPDHYLEDRCAHSPQGQGKPWAQQPPWQQR